MDGHGSSSCPHCGSQVYPEDVYCDNCGHQLPIAPKGTARSYDDKLTRPISGESVPSIEDGQVHSSKQGITPPAPFPVGLRSPKKIAWIGGAVVLGVALVWGAVYFLKGEEPSPGPEDALNSILRDSSNLSNSSNAASIDDPRQPTKEGLIAVPDDNGKIGYFNTYGEKIKPGTYEDGGNFVEGYANVRMNGKWGLIDKSYNVVLDYCAQELRTVNEGMVAIKIDGKYGCLDIKDIKDKKYSRLAIPAEYDNVGNFSSGLVVVTRGNRVFYMDKLGNLAFPNLPELERAWAFSDGVAAVKFAKPVSPDESLGLIDRNGNIKATFSGDTAGKLNDGLMPVTRKGGTWYLDKNLNPVLGPYKYATRFLNGLGAIDEGGKLGFIDKTGKFVVPCEYPYSDYDVRYGVICIIGEKRHYFDTTGKLLWEGGKLKINE